MHRFLYVWEVLYRYICSYQYKKYGSLLLGYHMTEDPRGLTDNARESCVAYCSQCGPTTWAQNLCRIWNLYQFPHYLHSSGVCMQLLQSVETYDWNKCSPMFHCRKLLAVQHSHCHSPTSDPRTLKNKDIKLELEGHDSAHISLFCFQRPLSK